MGKNVIREEFLSDTTWTAPAGVTRVKVSSINYIYSQVCGTAGAVLNNGDIYTWGYNVSGQLGLGDTTPRSSPVMVLAGQKWRQISGSSGFASAAGIFIGITAAGDAYSCGVNSDGQLGLGDVISRSSPNLVLTGKKWRQVVSISNTSCGIDFNGDGYSWGYNLQGQLGLGDRTPRSSPVLIVGSKKWRQLAMSGYSMWGIDSNGDGYSCGENVSGELGTGNVTFVSSPVLIVGSKKWIQLAGQTYAGFGIDNNNDLYAWGLTLGGGAAPIGIGPGQPSAVSSPVIVVGGIKFRQVCCGISYTMGVSLDGFGYAWGLNSNGQLGVGDVTVRSSPILIVGGIKWLRLFSGEASSFGLASDGRLYAWGLNANGQLGLGDVVPRSSPVLVLESLSYQAINQIESNQILMTVVPGTSYDVTVFGKAASLANYLVYQDPYGSGSIPTKIVIEYEA